MTPDDLAVARDVLLERFSPVKPYRYRWRIELARESRMVLTIDGAEELRTPIAFPVRRREVWQDRATCFLATLTAYQRGRRAATVQVPLPALQELARWPELVAALWARLEADLAAWAMATYSDGTPWGTPPAWVSEISKPRR